jgi:hypothetical protein
VLLVGCVSRFDRLTLCAETAEECGAVDVVDEGALSVDLDHGQPLAVPRLELRVAADVHLPEVELVLPSKLCERAPRTLAEVTAFGGVDDDARYGYSPRVIVASATRWTARP